MNLFITLLENVNKSRTSANNVSLTSSPQNVIHCNAGDVMWLCGLFVK
jgi:hypothetical protein